MTIETSDLLKSIMESFDRISHVASDELPNIDLYMDQVTTFMEDKMKQTARFPETDKILTKTMINNYAKNDLLPAPIKKKYSKEHILVLIFIYYFKGFLSIGDIQQLLEPLTEKFFRKEDGISLTDIYDEVFKLQDVHIERLKADVEKSFMESTQMFTDQATEDQAFLQRFAFICLLSFDVYIKKLLIEKLIDDMSPETGKEPKAKKDKQSKDKEVK